MRLKREMIWVLFRQVDADLTPIIEAMFDSPEAMARYFVNHDLAKRFRLGHDEEIYPKFTSKKFKFYSLVESERKKDIKVEKKGVDVKLAEDTPEEEGTKEAKLDDLLEEDEERPDAEEGDK